MEQIQALKELGLTKEIYELIQQWGLTNGIVFNDINFEKTSDSGESGDSDGKDEIAPGSVRTGDTTASRLTGTAASAARSAFGPSSSSGKSSVAAKLDEPKAAAAFRPVVEPKTITQPAAPAATTPTNGLTLSNFIRKELPEGTTDDIAAEIDRLADQIKPNEKIKDVFNRFKNSKSFSDKSQVADFEIFIAGENEENAVKESKYINPRQPKSFIRHPSLVGFMR